MTEALIHIPTLRTERLVLRAPRIEDVEPFAAFYATDAARFVGGPQADWQTWRYLAEAVGHWAFRGYGQWIVTRSDDDTAIGLIGIHYPPDWPEPEIGWMLWDTGKGYGTEAAIAARDWVYARCGLTTLISAIDPANTASAALAQRLGAVLEGTYEHPKHGTMHIWRHPGPEEAA